MRIEPLALEELAQDGVRRHVDGGARRTHCALYRLNRLWSVTLGQDLIEYSLMAGFVAVAAGAIMPNVAGSVSTIFSKVSSVLFNSAGAQSGMNGEGRPSPSVA
jgi:pilus assembly protein Flp/PilA